MGILDNFNRSNGAPGPNWDGLTDFFQIGSNQLHNNNSGYIFWAAAGFGASQEAFVTFSTIDPYGDEMDLLLKSQSSSWPGDGALEVWYDPVNHVVQVWTYTASQDWVQHGESISITFENGDQLGARATASGQVTVYKNGQTLGTGPIDITTWPYYDEGGYIGLWMVTADDAVLDDYGGGSLGGSSFGGVLDPKDSSKKPILPVSQWLKLHKGEQGGRKGLARQVNARRGSFVARPRSSPLEIGAGETITITYAYDALYRLTAADYSDGSYFHYAYDSVGNRLTEQTQAGTTSYVYDIANRLTSVNGVTYTWDNNGNLLSDGVNTYTYDHANRLASASGGGYNASYGYSGTGDRLRQTVNGVTTSYTLDLNTGLTQVLADGANTYLYGAGRIAQYDPEAQYFLGDALGSVRQLTDASGSVTLAKGYQPYGSTLTSAGGGFTNYAFTGEWEDGSTGMVYLRARYYAPWQGRFLTRDTWAGNPQQPISFNAWIYAGANPIVRVDPSGDCWIQLINGENRWFQDDDPICKNATYWEPYTLEDEYSMYLSQQIGPCTTCHLGKEKSPGEGFWVSNSELLTFRINAAQTYYSGVMLGVCGSHPYAVGVCSTISGVLDTNIITSKPFSSYNEKVSFLLTGWLATIFHYGNQSCMRLPLMDLPYIQEGSNAYDLVITVPDEYSMEFGYYQNPKYPEQLVPQVKFVSPDGTINIRAHGGQIPFREPSEWVVNVGYRVPPDTPYAQYFENSVGVLEYWLYPQSHVPLKTSLRELSEVFEINWWEP
jgi:RHS repeat-associated protein